MGQEYLMQLVVGWTCVGVFVSTAVITVLALVRIIQIDPQHLNRLFAALIIEVVAVSVATFGGLLKFDTEPINKDLAQGVVAQQQLEATSDVLASIETSSTTTAATAAADELPARVYIHISADSQRESALAVQAALRADGDLVPGIENVGAKAPNHIELRYFKRDDESDAARIAEAITSSGVAVSARFIPGFEQANIRPRHYELWYPKA